MIKSITLEKVYNTMVSTQHIVDMYGKFGMGVLHAL